MNNRKQLKTGGDPRTLPDYAALRDELGKLTHPARPDVNWHYAEKLCLALFEHNGVELQTAAWYTLARTRQGGLAGLNEGLAIMEALISRQWSTLWPQPIHARMEILSGLSVRIQQLMRTLSFNYGDLSQLYQAEQSLARLGAVLQRLELKHLSQLDALRILMHNSAVRLENSDGASGPGGAVQPGIALPVEATQNAEISVDGISAVPASEKIEPVNGEKWVYVAEPEFQPRAEAEAAEMPSSAKPGKFFAAGMVTMLMMIVPTLWGWQYFHQPDPLQARLAASLTPLPSVLSLAQLDALRQQAPVPEAFIANTQQQLVRLGQLPPDWTLDYRRQLVEQAQALWPEQAQPLARQWQQQLHAAALPVDTMNGWHQGMMKLQQLSDRLNGLDEQKGKYMTVSELKSVVYSTTQAFNGAVPAEEQLRRYADSASDMQLRQVEMALEQLQKRFFLLRQPQVETMSMSAKSDF